MALRESLFASSGLWFVVGHEARENAHIHRGLQGLRQLCLVYLRKFAHVLQISDISTRESYTTPACNSFGQHTTHRLLSLLNQACFRTVGLLTALSIQILLYYARVKQFENSLFRLERALNSE